MTWHTVIIPGRLSTVVDGKNLMWKCKDWCDDEIGPENEVWRFEWNYSGGETLRFLFAYPQHAVLFRLVHGL